MEPKTAPEMPLRLQAILNLDHAQRVLQPAAERLGLVVKRSRRLAPRLLAQRELQCLRR